MLLVFIVMLLDLHGLFLITFPTIQKKKKVLLSELDDVLFMFLFSRLSVPRGQET